MADTVCDLTRTCGPAVWRGLCLAYRDREDTYIKVTRHGKRSASIGLSSRELHTLRDLIDDLIEVAERVA